MVWDEALKLPGQDSDFHRKNLYKSISLGVFPMWKCGVQTLKGFQADDFDFDILDATKILARGARTYQLYWGAEAQPQCR